MPRHAPHRIDGVLRFYNRIDQRIAGIVEDRLRCACSRANGKFASPPFSLPNAELLFNVAGNAYDSNVKLEVQDRTGKPIAGF